MNIRNGKFLKITIFLIVWCSLLYPNNGLIIKESKPGILVLEFTVDSVWFSDDHKKIFTKPNLDLYHEVGQPILPYYSEVLLDVPSNANVNIFTSKKIELGKYSPLEQNQDIFSLDENEPQVDLAFEGSFPSNSATMGSTVEIYGKSASVLNIFPIGVSSGKLSLIKNITVQISWSNANNSVIPKLLSKISFSELKKNKISLKKDFSFSIPDYQYSENIAKITIDTTGWYGISREALVDSGVDIKNIDPNTLRLWNKEDEILIFVEGDEDGTFDKKDQIIFYGEKNRSPDGSSYDNNFYTNENVYWLTWGKDPGIRYLTESVYPDKPINQVYFPQQGTYRTTVKIERDEVFKRMGVLNTDEQWDIMDHFFMYPATYLRETVNYPFVLPHPDRSSNSNFDLKVNVQSMTKDSLNLSIKINDRLTTESSWHNKKGDSIEILSDIDEGFESEFLENDTNLISLSLSGFSPDQLSGEVYLNWFEIIYDKQYLAFNDYIKFSRDKSISITTHFTIENFTNSDIFIFKEGISRLRDFLVEKIGENQYDVQFQDYYGENSPPYYAFTREQLIQPIYIKSETPIENNLRDIQNTYIAISPDSFISIIDPLAQVHDGVVVDVNDIYRQYSYGIISPYGIKSFLQDVYYTGGKLKHVLIGMLNKDYFAVKEALLNNNYIPSMQIIAKEYGAIITDYWYSCLDDDVFPEIEIGRFPASTITEVENVVNKSLDHINRSTSTWDNNILFIAGFEEKFKEQSESLLRGWVDNGNFISRLYIDVGSEQTSFYGTTDTLLQHLDRGLSYINFVGHGGGGVWGDRSILGLSAVDNISNGFKLPFVTSMTCFTGDYSNPNSLGVKMIVSETGGALAWYASAGKSWISNNFLVTVPINKLLYSDNNYTFGEMVNLSKIQYYVTHFDITRRAQTQLYQFNLAGDPALKLKKHSTQTPTVTPINPEAGGQIQINFQNTPVDSLYYQFFIDDYFSNNNSSYIGQTSGFTFDIPDTLNAGNYRLNISYKSNNKAYSHSQLFTLQGSKIENIVNLPENPTYLDSIDITAQIQDNNGIQAVQLFINNTYYTDMVNISENNYKLKSKIPPQTAGSKIHIKLRVLDGINNETLSSEKVISIFRVPNIFPSSLYFTANDVISLKTDVENSVPAPANANVKLEIDKGAGWVLIGEKPINFTGKEVSTISFTGYFPSGINNYRIIASTSYNLSDTADDTLNVTLPTEYFWVTNGLGTTDNGTSHSEVSNANFKLEINPGIVEQSSIINIKKIDDVVIPFQPDFSIADNFPVNNAFEVLWDSNNEYMGQWQVGEIINSPDRLYKYFEEYNTWLPQEFSQLNNTTIRFTSSGSGKYAILNSSDSELPVINTTINGQKYLPRSYINDSPVVSLSVYDDNGIDFRSDSIKVLINNLAVENIINNINGSGGNLGVELNPVFTENDSILSVIMQDAAGNKTDTLNLKFIVTNELTLIDYGNYPNPFIDKTVFAYELSETVDDFSFIIYSVEGRKIRRLTKRESNTDLELRYGGYHEIYWDGSNDSDEDIIGNGNYFYLIRATKGEEILERSGKIVKVKIK